MNTKEKRRVTLSHGGGGTQTRALVEEVFLPAFEGSALKPLGDSAVLDVPAGRTAFTTDSFVVKPLFFRGGDIGRLAVCGTVNDLAVTGADPLYMSVGFVLEEGLPVEELVRISASMAGAAREAGVEISAGDTKVVERGSADGLYINTAGIGTFGGREPFSPSRILPGDKVIITGTIGDHGIAVLSEREGLRFSTPVVSDVAPLASLARSMRESGQVHAMRDPTRGGAAAALNELARAGGVGVMLDEEAIPVRKEVKAACDMLGLDPMAVANEGKIVAFVSAESSEAVLAAVRAHPLGKNGCTVGEAVSERPGAVIARNALGGTRIVEMPYGEILPRIC